MYKDKLNQLKKMAEVISNQKTTSKISRDQKMKKIRSSLTELSLMAQNHNMVQLRLTERKESNSKDSEMTTKSEDSSKGEDSFELTQVFSKKYSLLSKIGEGTNGVVHKAVKKRTGEVFAVKCFKVQDEHLFQVKTTFQILRSLRHHGVVKYQALYIDMKRHCGWLVMEFLDFPTLAETKLESESDIKNVMIQLLNTLSYLHRQSIVHRDVKPENILYDPVTKKIKLIDFGIAKRFVQRSIFVDLLTQTGTLYYRAPEMFNSGGYREGVDVWAAGITLFKLFTGITPFQSQYHLETIEQIRKSEINFQNKQEFKSDLKILIKKMLAKKSEQRISAKSCLEEPWLKSYILSSSGSSLSDDCLTKCDSMKTPPLLREKSRKRKFSEMLMKGEEVSKMTKSYIDEMHCYDSEWEQEPLSGVSISNKIQ